MAILVIGATGFIGPRLIRKLIAEIALIGPRGEILSR